MKQRGDYRIFVGAFPTGELSAEIQTVRERYDRKTARITPPHVTLWGTMWRNGSATAENEVAMNQVLADIVKGLRPFMLELGEIKTFNQRVVYFGVGGSGELTDVRERLVDGLGKDKHGRRFTPHLTMAMRLKRPQVTRMVDELAASKWGKERFMAPIDRLQLMQRAPDDPAWRVIGVHLLSGR